jgi:hypothetical protein
MNRPPVLMRMRFHNKDRKFGLWLPLFLLIPIALLVLIILSPLILIAILVLWPSGWGKLALVALKAAWGLFCSMRGLQVDFKNHRECVYISVI